MGRDWVRRRRRERGFSLIELMVGLLVGLLVMLGVISVYLIILRTSEETLAAARLNQEIRAAMIVVTADLRRAGFWNRRAPGAPDENPAELITIGGGGNCVTYSYDRDESGQIDDGENFGFRVAQNTLQIWTDPGPADCDNNNGWEVLVGDSVVRLTELLFDTNDADAQPLAPNYLRVVLTGERDDRILGSVGMTVSETVLLRNARIAGVDEDEEGEEP